MPLSEDQRATVIALLEDALKRLKAGEDLDFSVNSIAEETEPRKLPTQPA